MKNSIIVPLLAVSLLASVLLLAACNDDGSPSCSSICSRISDCPGDSGDMTVDDQINECMEECSGMKAVLQSGVYDTIATCAKDKMCSGEDIEDACFADALSQCAPGDAADAFLDVLCTKMVDCDVEGMTDKNTCLASVSRNTAVYCMKTDVYEQTAACIDNSTCDTAEKCLEDLLFFDDDDISSSSL